jgi:hypothetical protein
LVEVNPSWWYMGQGKKALPFPSFSLTVTRPRFGTLLYASTFQILIC